MTEPLNRKMLYDLVWKKPMVDVAKEYGLSDRGLAKLCERNSIPVPPRGYWARKNAGQKVIKPPLIVVDPKEPETVILLKRANTEKESSSKENSEPKLPIEIQEAIERESLPLNFVKVPKTLSNPHPIVAKWIEKEERELNNYKKYGGWSEPSKITSLERRRRRIISTILKALEIRGFKAELELEYDRSIAIIYERDRIWFSIEERIHQFRRKITEEEKKDSMYSNNTWRQITEPTGELILRLSSENRRKSYDAVDFKESDGTPLEKQLNNIIAAVIEKIWCRKKNRLAAEERERQYWKERERKLQIEELLKTELERKQALETKASNWKKAQDIRDYVGAVTKAYEGKHFAIESTEFLDWKKWALAHARDLDPIESENPLIALAAE